MFPFTKYSKIYYIISGIVIVAAIASLAVFGLKFGIEFTGGSTMEVEFQDHRPDNEEISKVFSDLNLGEVVVQPTGDKGAFLKLKGIDEETHQKVLQKLRESAALEELRFESIGPVIGKELTQKTQILILISSAVRSPIIKL